MLAAIGGTASANNSPGCMQKFLCLILVFYLYCIFLVNTVTRLEDEKRFHPLIRRIFHGKLCGLNHSDGGFFHYKIKKAFITEKSFPYNIFQYINSHHDTFRPSSLDRRSYACLQGASHQCR